MSIDPRKIRFLFHEILNKANIISVNAGYYSAFSQMKNIDTMSQEELLQEIKKILTACGNMENAALEIGKMMYDLKKDIYPALHIDITKTLGQVSHDK